jgi:uncharacterized phage protein (predicted DNA packaging)
MTIRDDIKNYLKIDDTSDDTLLDSLIISSTAIIKNATGITIDQADQLQKLALMMTVGHYYTNRDYVIISGAVPQRIPMTLQTLYSQLKRIQEGVENV